LLYNPVYTTLRQQKEEHYRELAHPGSYRMKRLIICCATCLILGETLAMGSELVCEFRVHHMFVNRHGDPQPVQSDTRLVVTLERGDDYVVRMDGRRMEQVAVVNNGDTITFVNRREIVHDAAGWNNTAAPLTAYSLGISGPESGSAIMTGVFGSLTTLSFGSCNEAD
jgi:hypothetical protein